jgi:hypothetical protein
MTEREQALIIANKWLDFDMNALVQMVPGDPDCDACVLARQFIRAVEQLGAKQRRACPVCDGVSEHKWNCILNRVGG